MRIYEYDIPAYGQLPLYYRFFFLTGWQGALIFIALAQAPRERVADGVRGSLLQIEHEQTAD